MSGKESGPQRRVGVLPAGKRLVGAHITVKEYTNIFDSLTYH